MYVLFSIVFACNILHRSFDYCLKNKLKISDILFFARTRLCASYLCTLIIGDY